MSEEHFTYFRVQNFKGFRDLELKNIGQFNLILGDNNVGKTSLLEAFLWDMDFEIFQSKLARILTLKGLGSHEKQSLFKFFINSELVANNKECKLIVSFSKSLFPDRIDETTYFFDFQNGLVELTSTFNLEERSLSLGKYSHVEIPFIPFSYGFSNDLVDNYSKYVQKNRAIKHALINELRRIDQRIEDIEIDISRFKNEPSLIVYFQGQNGSIPLGMLGDGIIKLFRIFIEIIISRNRILLIDEIDTGIHYSRLKDYWKVILESAEENNVQLFSTTHNKECIEAYEQAIKELGEEAISKSRVISLKKTPDTHDVVAYTSAFDVLESAVALGNDLR